MRRARVNRNNLSKLHFHFPNDLSLESSNGINNLEIESSIMHALIKSDSMVRCEQNRPNSFVKGIIEMKTTM